MQDRWMAASDDGGERYQISAHLMVLRMQRNDPLVNIPVSRAWFLVLIFIVTSRFAITMINL